MADSYSREDLVEGRLDFKPEVREEIADRIRAEFDAAGKPYLDYEIDRVVTEFAAEVFENNGPTGLDTLDNTIKVFTEPQPGPGLSDWVGQSDPGLSDWINTGQPNDFTQQRVSPEQREQEAQAYRDTYMPMKVEVEQGPNGTEYKLIGNEANALVDGMLAGKGLSDAQIADIKSDVARQYLIDNDMLVPTGSVLAGYISDPEVEAGYKLSSTSPSGPEVTFLDVKEAAIEDLVASRAQESGIKVDAPQRAAPQPQQQPRQQAAPQREFDYGGISRADLQQVQAQLNALGIVGANRKPLTEDGLPGRNTDAALQTFEQQFGVDFGSDITAQDLGVIAQQGPQPEMGDRPMDVNYMMGKIEEATAMYMGMLDIPEGADRGQIERDLRAAITPEILGAGEEYFKEREEGYDQTTTFMNVADEAVDKYREANNLRYDFEQPQADMRQDAPIRGDGLQDLWGEPEPAASVADAGATSLNDLMGEPEPAQGPSVAEGGISRDQMYADLESLVEARKSELLANLEPMVDAAKQQYPEFDKADIAATLRAQIEGISADKSIADLRDQFADIDRKREELGRESFLKSDTEIFADQMRQVSNQTPGLPIGSNEQGERILIMPEVREAEARMAEQAADREFDDVVGRSGSQQLDDFGDKGTEPPRTTMDMDVPSPEMRAAEEAVGRDAATMDAIADRADQIDMDGLNQSGTRRVTLDEQGRPSPTAAEQISPAAVESLRAEQAERNQPDRLFEGQEAAVTQALFGKAVEGATIIRNSGDQLQVILPNGNDPTERRELASIATGNGVKMFPSRDGNILVAGSVEDIEARVAQVQEQQQAQVQQPTAPIPQPKPAQPEQAAGEIRTPNDGKLLAVQGEQLVNPALDGTEVRPEAVHMVAVVDNPDRSQAQQALLEQGVGRRTSFNNIPPAEEALVMEAQQKMADLGYDLDPEGKFANGGIDGKMGQVTEAQVKKFQQENGLEVTGKIDATLVNKLDEIKAGKQQTMTAAIDPMEFEAQARATTPEQQAALDKALSEFRPPASLTGSMQDASVDESLVAGQGAGKAKTAEAGIAV